MPAHAQPTTTARVVRLADYRQKAPASRPADAGALAFTAMATGWGLLVLGSTLAVQTAVLTAISAMVARP